MLATGFVFAIHFFSANLRPEKFPMDTSIFTGQVSEEELEEERPELVRRLRESGQLEQYLAPAPSRPTLTLTMLAGFLALSIGLAHAGRDCHRIAVSNTRPVRRTTN